MLLAADAFPINLAFLGKGNASQPEALRQQIEAGAVGLKLHEDWGTTPAAIDCCLGVAEATDTQVSIHSDTLNESGFVEDTIAATKGRTLCAFHTEGAGGGHAPDILRVVGEPNFLPSSTNPTMPFTANTVDEHLDMLMVCHHLDASIAEDLAFAESRIRRETIAAEDVLHDLGAISMMSSDSQAMGRVGEMVLRTWQTAHKMKLQRGSLPEDSARNDNFRAKRYVAKYTINPAIANGMSHDIGSIEVGKWADLVFWKPAFFGVKALAGDEGRADRDVGHGRPEREHPDAAAGALPSDVRRLRRRGGAWLSHLRQPGGAGGGPGRHAGPAQAALGGAPLPQRGQAPHGAQRLHADDADRRAEPTRCAPTAYFLPARPRPACRWPSGTSCSEAAAGPPAPLAGAGPAGTGPAGADSGPDRAGRQRDGHCAGRHSVARRCRREVPARRAAAHPDGRQGAAHRKRVGAPGRSLGQPGRAHRPQRSGPAVGAAPGKPGAALAAEGNAR